MSDRKSATRARVLQEQHAEIHELIEQLERGWADGGSDAPPVRVDPNAFALLVRLENLLAAHFSLEEQGGYLADELLIAPRLGAMADRLVKQHAALKERIRRIHELAEAPPPQPDGRTFTRAVRDFARQLHEHETAENRLIQEAYFDDLGGG